MVSFWSLPDVLRRLRRDRGLTMGELAHRARVSVSALQGWESGRQVPKGRSLVRVLDAMEAPERIRARLLAEADPVHARIVLGPTRFGALPHAGDILRAMRMRRGLTQAELGRLIGVAQGTVAKWEIGDNRPTTETFHALGVALDLTVEETVALASAGEGMAEGLPSEPGPVIRDERLPLGLQEVVLLGQEAELWRRAVADALWEPVLAYALAYRAHLYVLERRFSEVADVAERALRLATTSEGRMMATPAVNALTEVGRQRGDSPTIAARMCGAWAERLPDSVFKAWMMGSEGMNLIRSGRTEEGLARVRQARDLDDALGVHGPEGESLPGLSRAESLARALLAAKRPEQAAAAIESFRHPTLDPLLHAQVQGANGRALDGASLAYLRHYVRRIPGHRSAINLTQLDAVESTQARLWGGLPPDECSVGDSESETRRRWSAIPNAHPWPA